MTTSEALAEALRLYAVKWNKAADNQMLWTVLVVFATVSFLTAAFGAAVIFLLGSVDAAVTCSVLTISMGLLAVHAARQSAHQKKMKDELLGKMDEIILI